MTAASKDPELSDVVVDVANAKLLDNLSDEEVHAAIDLFLDALDDKQEERLAG